MRKASVIALFALATLMTLPKWNFLQVWRWDFADIWLSGQATRLGVDPYGIQAFFALARGYHGVDHRQAPESAGDEQHEQGPGDHLPSMHAEPAESS